MYRCVVSYGIVNYSLIISPPPKQFKADRPFYFELKGGQETLFIGSHNTPKDA